MLRMDTVYNYTYYLTDGDAIDWLAAAIESATHTAAIPKLPPTATELLLIKMRRRLASHRYRSRHPDRIKARGKLRWNVGLNGDATANDVALQLKSQKNKCWWCGKKLKDDYHVDHRVPLDKGGSNTAGNIVISCASCNLSKGAKMPHEWNGRLL